MAFKPAESDLKMRKFSLLEREKALISVINTMRFSEKEEAKPKR